jgi:hypothetical protein
VAKTQEDYGDYGQADRTDSVADLIPQWYEGGTQEQKLDEAYAQIRRLESKLAALSRLPAAEGRKPVAWMFTNEEGDDDFGNNYVAIKNKSYKGGNIVPLYASPAPGMELEAICKFLLGEEAYKGFWFGEKPAGEMPYWWRKHLRDALTALRGEK